MAEIFTATPFLKPGKNGVTAKTLTEARKRIMAYLADYEAKLTTAAKVEPPYEYHKSVWLSERQRRAVLAKISSGSVRIPYQRTGNLARGWRSDTTAGLSVVTSRVWNSSPAAKYAVGKRQSRRSTNMKIRGWVTIHSLFKYNRRKVLTGLKRAVQGYKYTLMISRP